MCFDLPVDEKNEFAIVLALRQNFDCFACQCNLIRFATFWVSNTPAIVVELHVMPPHAEHVTFPGTCPQAERDEID